MIGAAVLWGTTGTAQALAPAEAQPLAVGTLRLVVGGLVLLIFQLVTRGHPRVARRDLPLILLAAACMAAYQVLFFAGVKMTGVAVGTIVGIGVSPVLAGLLGFLFRSEKPGWKWAAATLLAVSGCALLALSGREAVGAAGVNLLGLLFAAGAGAAYAIFSLAGKHILDRQPVQTVMAGVFCLGALILSPLLLTQDLRWLAQPRGLGVVLHLGFFATALAYILFGLGLQRTPLATAVTLSLAEPLTAGMLGVLVLGEKLSVQAGFGILLIFSGLVVLSVRAKGARKLMAASKTSKLKSCVK